MSREPGVFQKTIDLYYAGKIEEAYDLLTPVGNRYPDWTGRVYEIRLDLAALLGKLDLAENILEEALSEGFYYGENVLRLDTDVKDLQGRERYEALVKKSLGILAENQQISTPEMLLLEPMVETHGPIPWLMALHGNNSNAGAMQEYWDGLRRRGWLIALPQSSQLTARNQYVWNDMPLVEKEIAAHVRTLENQFSLSKQKGLVAGFSKGGHAAIHCALKSIVPINGFLGLAPYFADPSAIAPLSTDGNRTLLKGYFLLGENDHECNPGALKLTELLAGVGVECAVEVVPKIAHSIPDEMDPYMSRVCKFIFGEESE